MVQASGHLFILASTALLGASLVAAQEKTHWVGTWASSPQLVDAGNAPPAPGFSDSTLRQIVHVSIGGKQMRVRFSNAFGTAPLILDSVHVAKAGEGSSIQPGTDQALTFHGRTSATIPAGALIISDPIVFDLAALSNLAVTVHLKNAPPEITTHPGSRTTSYLQAGDFVSAPELPMAARTDHWYYLNGIDVPASNSAAAVVVLGDSITDGRNSTTNKNGRWTDFLARRLQARKVGVLNEGIGGNRLLRDGLGPNALARLDRDVLAQSAVRWLIVLEGVNDIGTGSQAEDIIAAYEQITERAHARGIRVYGATVMAFEGFTTYFNAETEAIRQTVNTWIRTSKKFDAVIDFDAASRDPKSPSHLSAAADSGDHLHPADGGYRIMADAIDLRLFAK